MIFRGRVACLPYGPLLDRGLHSTTDIEEAKERALFRKDGGRPAKAVSSDRRHSPGGVRTIRFAESGSLKRRRLNEIQSNEEAAAGLRARVVANYADICLACRTSSDRHYSMPGTTGLHVVRD